MNKVGKIIACIIMLMSVVCLFLSAYSYASQRKWKGEYDKKVVELAKAQQDRRAAISDDSLAVRQGDRDRNELQQSIIALKTKISVLEEENQMLQEVADNLNKVKKYDDMSTAELASAVDAESKTHIGYLQKHLDAVSENVANAQQSRANYLQKLAETMTQLHDKSVEYSELKSLNDENTANFDNALTVLNKNGVSLQYSDAPRNDVEGSVISEDNGGLFLISLGADDGLSVHNQLDVKRGDTYLGKLEVMALESNRAVCKVMSEYRQGGVMQGDVVYSKSVN